MNSISSQSDGPGKIKPSQEDTRSSREGELRYHAIFERTNDAIFVFDLNGIHLDVNQQGTEFLGITRDGMIGMPVYKLISPMMGYDSFEVLAARNLERDGYSKRFSRKEFKRRLELDGQILGIESAWKTRDGDTYIFGRAQLPFGMQLGISCTMKALLKISPSECRQRQSKSV